MEANVYKNELDIACERFRKILEEQLIRVEDMKAQDGFVDYAALDTIKIGDKSAFVESTPERKFAWQAQTPQVFGINAYRAAAYIARDEKLDVTDDASMLEHLRIPVKLCEGARENIKITDKSDLIYARAILESRKESE